MTTLSKPVRALLEAHYTVDRPEVATAQLSEDGTRKWLLRFPDRQEIETVHIPQEARGTLCVSSQVGCTLTCRFCHTGTQRPVRHPGAAAIAQQVMLARAHLDDWTAAEAERPIPTPDLRGLGRSPNRK